MLYYKQLFVLKKAECINHLYVLSMRTCIVPVVVTVTQIPMLFLTAIFSHQICS